MRRRLARPPLGVGRYSERILLVLSLAWLGIVTGWLLVPPLLPAIIDELGLTLSAVGLLLTAFQASTAVVLYPSGRLSDHLGRSTVIVPALAVFVVGLVLFGGAGSYPVLLLGALTLGLGNGLYAISSRALISDLFTDRRGGALGVFGAGFNIGGVVAAVVALVALARWRAPFAAIAVLLVVAGLGFVYWNREPYALGRVDVGFVPTVRRLFSYRDLRGPVVAYSLFYLVTQSFLGFFPTYLHEVKGVSPALASAGFALVFAVGAVSKVLAGVISDRAPRQLVALLGVLLAAGGLVGLLLANGIVALALSTVVFAIGHQSQFPLIDAILMDAVPAASLGGDIGAARTIFRVVGSVGPVYVGVVAQRLGLAAAFGGLLVLLLAVGAFFALSVRRSR